MRERVRATAHEESREGEIHALGRVKWVFEAPQAPSAPLPPHAKLSGLVTPRPPGSDGALIAFGDFHGPHFD